MEQKLWVLGGTSGIGAEVYETLGRQGTFFETHSTDHESADVTDTFGLRKYVEEHGPFTHVVYSAGINRLSWIKDQDSNDVKDILDVNLIGFIRLLKVLSNEQVVSPRVVAIGSDAADRPMRTSVAYCASKAALHMAVRVAARELGPLGWRVNCVAPGMTGPTNMQEYIDQKVPEIRNWSLAKAISYEQSSNPLGRRAHVSEIAEVVCDVLMGPDYLNGSIITVNGGR